MQNPAVSAVAAQPGAGVHVCVHTRTLLAWHKKMACVKIGVQTNNHRCSQNLLSSPCLIKNAWGSGTKASFFLFSLLLFSFFLFLFFSFFYSKTHPIWIGTCLEERVLAVIGWLRIMPSCLYLVVLARDFDQKYRIDEHDVLNSQPALNHNLVEN